VRPEKLRRKTGEVDNIVYPSIGPLFCCINYPIIITSLNELKYWVQRAQINLTDSVEKLTFVQFVKLNLRFMQFKCLFSCSEHLISGRESSSGNPQQILTSYVQYYRNFTLASTTSPGSSLNKPSTKYFGAISLCLSFI
jgi:hypothetical protein